MHHSKENQSNSQPFIHFTICWLILVEDKSVGRNGTLSCVLWLLHLFWVWGYGHDYERERWKLDMVPMKKRSSRILCRWTVSGTMLDFQFVAEKQEDDRSHAILRKSWMKAQLSIINRWQIILNPGQCCSLSQKHHLLSEYKSILNWWCPI